jgi:serine/threonine protein kinase
VALRAPEVVLQISFDHQIDIWSFGCYLFEVFTGEPLFTLSNFNPARIDDDHSQQMNDNNGLVQKDDNNYLLKMRNDNQLLEMNDDDHLLQMISTLGPLPSTMFEKWPRRMRYFDANLNLIRTDVGKSENALGAICIGATLEQRVQDNRPTSMTAEESVALVHVLRLALEYDPAKRPSATELLGSDWFCCE